MIDHADRTWWRQAVVYQVYIRSFADGNGDGIGDIESLRYRPPYLRDLLSLIRDPGFRCIVNPPTEPIHRPARDTALPAGGPLDGGFLPSNTAIRLGR